MDFLDKETLEFIKKHATIYVYNRFITLWGGITKDNYMYVGRKISLATIEGSTCAISALDDESDRMIVQEIVELLDGYVWRVRYDQPVGDLFFCARLFPIS